MNIIRAFIFMTILASAALQASQSDETSDKTKASSEKKSPSKTTLPKEKAATKKNPAPKEKTTPQKQSTKEKPAEKTVEKPQKKLKPSAASTAILLKQSATPGYIAPFENTPKPSEEKTAEISPVVKKNAILTTSAKIQNLGDVEIGNSSNKAIQITGITFSYTSSNFKEKNQTALKHTRTHKITFPQGHIIPPQKKLVFTITMKNHENLELSSIKSIQTHYGHILFDTPITDISKPIVLSLDTKGKIQYAK